MQCRTSRHLVDEHLQLNNKTVNNSSSLTLDHFTVLLTFSLCVLLYFSLLSPLYFIFSYFFPYFFLSSTPPGPFSYFSFVFLLPTLPFLTYMFYLPVLCLFDFFPSKMEMFKYYSLSMHKLCRNTELNFICMDTRRDSMSLP